MSDLTMDIDIGPLLLGAAIFAAYFSYRTYYKVVSLEHKHDSDEWVYEANTDDNAEDDE